SIGKKFTEEYAVMVDPFRPLQLTEEALKVEDPTYKTSWLENIENHLEDRSQE
ncbi:MAG TPA: homogentisate 1,2-dioxygenase, partial [Chryseobacterium sp.]|nr:homogentisate 1,2-dioxygenase [Chryseobacterium sp.]